MLLNGCSKVVGAPRGVGSDDTATTIAMPLNEWIHIACVYDNVSNTKKIYINGSLNVTANTTNTTDGAKVTASTHNKYIGARVATDNTGIEAYFAGMLDDVRIYNRALSAGEVDYLSDPTP